MISLHKGTLSAAPNFAFEYCLQQGKVTDEELIGCDLSSLRVLLNGAEPVRPETCRSFKERFRDYGLAPSALLAGYGLAEATLAVTRGSSASRHFNASLLSRGIASLSISGSARTLEIASCGRPLDNLRIEIRSSRSNHVLTDCEVGEVCVSGGSITSGYWQHPDSQYNALRDEEESLRAGPRLLHTRDLGFFFLGELYICGRASDIIVQRGSNYHAQDIETSAIQYASRTRGQVAFQDTDGFTTLLLEAGDLQDLPDPSEIRSTVGETTGLFLNRVIIVAPRSVVRTTSGKISRKKTQSALHRGDIQPLVESVLSHKGIESAGGPVAWLSDLLARHPHLSRAPLSEAGIDSLQLVELQLELESKAKACLGEGVSTLLDGPTLQHCPCEELLLLSEAFDKGNTLEGSRLLSRLVGQGLEAKLAEQQRMRQDAKLDFPRVQSYTSPTATQADRIVLIGGTGFFGPYLLYSLLRQSKLPIVVIARGDSDDHARFRVLDALERNHLSSEGDASLFTKRLSVWRGDLSEPLLGLTASHFEELAGSSFALYHNAAKVDYVRNYEALRPANIIGTNAVLALAMTAPAKQLHYISSTFIFGWTKKAVLYEDDCNKEMFGLDFGYSQSKWVAERQVHRAKSLGLAVAIYRPSLISVASSIRGDQHDVIARLMAFMIKYGVAVDTPNQLSLLPVDLLAHNLIAVSQQALSSPTPLHLTADVYYSLTELVKEISRLFGYQFEYFEILSFTRRLSALAGQEDPIFPLLDFFTRSAPRIAEMSHKRYSNTRFQEARRQVPNALAEPSLEEVARRLVLFLLSQGWIQEPTSEPQKAIQ